MLLIGLAAMALVTIIWLLADTLAPAQKSILPADLMEFMQATGSYNDPKPPPSKQPQATDEWRITPISHATSMTSMDAILPQKNVANFSPPPLDGHGSGREGLQLPQAKRDLLAARPSAALSQKGRPTENPRRATIPPVKDYGSVSKTASEEKSDLNLFAGDFAAANLQPPHIALVIARAGIDTQPAISTVANEPEDRNRHRRNIQSIRPKRSTEGAFASETALANASGVPEPTLDDLFTLKLHGEYGTSKANLEGGGSFQDRFLVLGGKKRFDFAGMDQVDLKVDGVITTGGHWNTSTVDQKLSGIALNIGPEIKFPELPVKLDLNVGAAWLKREATLTRNDPHLGLANSRADIDSMVYGGGAALRNDWQWRMFTVTGLAGIQYAAATDKSHAYSDPATSLPTGAEVKKQTQSSWDIPLQVRIGGEYKLLNALSVLPSLWGGYTYNITGKNGAFHNGHIAGAEATWRRHGMTWNRSSYHFGGELRIRVVDRFEMWLSHQKEWAGNDSGSYTGGGLQIAF